MGCSVWNARVMLLVSLWTMQIIPVCGWPLSRVWCLKQVLRENAAICPGSILIQARWFNHSWYWALKWILSHHAEQPVLMWLDLVDDRALEKENKVALARKEDNFFFYYFILIVLSHCKATICLTWAWLTAWKGSNSLQASSAKYIQVLGRNKDFVWIATEN